MVGDDGQTYGQGYMYDFDEGRFMFFNGQMVSMRLTEQRVWECIPGYPDPVADALEAQRGGTGSVTLIYEPDTTWWGH